MKNLSGPETTKRRSLPPGQNHFFGTALQEAAAERYRLQVEEMEDLLDAERQREFEMEDTMLALTAA